MASTFNDIWRELRFYAPDAPVQLIQSLTKDAFQEIRDSKLWSWAVAEDQFTTIAEVNDGTIAVVNGDETVTGTGTNFVSALEGEQIKIKTRIYTVATVTNATSLELDRVWAEEDQSGLGYSIFTAYVTVPQEFYGFVSVIDPTVPVRLFTNFDVSQLDFFDPRRQVTGNPQLLADLRWSPDTDSAPMYELWPHQKIQRGFRLLYWRLSADFSKVVQLPYTIPDRLIKQYVKAELAEWPGTLERPNPLHSIAKARHYRDRYDTTLLDVQLQDDDIYLTDLWTNVPMVSLTAEFLRDHSIGFPGIGHHGHHSF